MKSVGRSTNKHVFGVGSFRVGGKGSLGARARVDARVLIHMYTYIYIYYI